MRYEEERRLKEKRTITLAQFRQCRTGFDMPWPNLPLSSHTDAEYDELWAKLDGRNEKSHELTVFLSETGDGQFAGFDCHDAAIKTIVELRAQIKWLENAIAGTRKPHYCRTCKSIHPCQTVRINEQAVIINDLRCELDTATNRIKELEDAFKGLDLSDWLELQAELERLRKEVPPKDATAIFIEIPEEVKVFNLRIWGYAAPYSHSEPEHEIIWRISRDQNAPEFFPNDGGSKHYKPFKGWRKAEKERA